MEGENVKSKRMVCLLLWLQEKKGQWVSVGMVLEALSLEPGSRRSVERDLQVLEGMGLCESRGKGPAKHYRHPLIPAKISFSDLKADDFFSFLLMTRLQHSQMQGAACGLDHIAGLLAQGASAGKALHGKDLYDEFYRRFGEYVSFMGEMANVGPRDSLVPVLFQGLVRRRVLHIAYQGMKDEEPRERLIEPWHMVAFRNELYFLCPRSEDPTRLFRCKLSRIVKARLMSESFEVDWKVLRPEIDFLEHSIGMWSERDSRLYNIRLAFGWGMRLYLEERRIHPSQKCIERVDGETGEKWVEVRLKTCISEDLLDWVRRWGRGVEVLSPPQLRKEMREYGEWLSQTY